MGGLLLLAIHKGGGLDVGQSPCCFNTRGKIGQEKLDALKIGNALRKLPSLFDIGHGIIKRALGSRWPVLRLTTGLYLRFPGQCASHSLLFPISGLPAVGDRRVRPQPGGSAPPILSSMRLRVSLASVCHSETPKCPDRAAQGCVAANRINSSALAALVMKHLWPCRRYPSAVDTARVRASRGVRARLWLGQGKAGEDLVVDHAPKNWPTALVCRKILTGCTCTEAVDRICGRSTLAASSSTRHMVTASAPSPP